MFKFVITAKMQNGDAWETIRHTKEGLDIVIQDILKDDTVIAFDVEVFDTDSAISSGVFTVPSGKAGKYFFSVNGGMNTSNTINTIKIFLSKNSQTDITSNAGDAIGIQFKHSGTPSEIIHSLSGTMDLAVGDTVRVYINHDYGSNKVTEKRGQFTFSGNKLI